VVSHADGVERYRPGDDRERNLELGTSWFQSRDDWPAVPVDDGPDEWQRATAEIVVDQRLDPLDADRRRVDRVAPLTPIDPVELDPVTVSDVVVDEQEVSFTVDRVGVPVLVRVSYFPNWHVEGADGPYRAGANHMVVVPTSEEVRLVYDVRSGLDWFFYALTALGIALCFLWRRRGDVVHAGPVPTFGRPSGDAPTGDGPHTEVRDSGDSEVTGWEPPAGPAGDTGSLPDRHVSPG
jgi:hypothetical protein